MKIVLPSISSYHSVLERRFAGTAKHAAAASGAASIDLSNQVIPAHFFSDPVLWIGVAAANSLREQYGCDAMALPAQSEFKNVKKETKMKMCQGQ